MTYAILIHPGHNRVYFETSLRLSMAEFQIAAGDLSVEWEDVRLRNIGGVEYLTFRTADRLTAADIRVVSDLSFAYAIFEAEDAGGSFCLRPVPRIRADFVDESISTILKYTGKTNEIFTRMMINVAFYSQNNRENIRLLDPIAGKGTTLYEGLIKGYDVCGIEIGDKAVNEAYHFVRRFFETAKYKFDQNTLRLSGPNRSFSALRHTFRAAATKEDFKAGKVKTVEMVAGNSVYADRYYRKNSFDLIVGDLPYGVQHGNVTNEKQSSLTRNPTELLGVCLPAWGEVLKPGGVIALAWNSSVLRREKMEEIFSDRGFEVQNDGAYLQFEHRVDQSIVRDILVAKKP